MYKKKMNFYDLHKVVNNFIYTKKIHFYYLHKVINSFLTISPNENYSLVF